MASIDELLSLSSIDVSRMSRRELSNVVSKLASAANKRLRRLERSPMGTESPAYKSAMKRGNFSVAGKNQGQLQNEYKRVRNFLRMKTSSVTKWKKFKAETYERLGEGFVDEDAEKLFWAAYREIASSEAALNDSYGSDQTQRFLRSEDSETFKPLTEEEKRIYRVLYEGDERNLDGLSQIETASIRTLIELREAYETKQSNSKTKTSNAKFFTIRSDDS